MTRTSTSGSDAVAHAAPDRESAQTPQICVYGLGPAGTALSVILSSLTDTVLAADTDGTRVAAVEHGNAPTTDPPVATLIPQAVEAGVLQATTELPAAAAETRIHLITVETGIRRDGAPDLSALRAAVRDIGSGLTAGDLVIVASVVPPGTTRDLVGTVLADESDLSVDEIGLVACSLPTSPSLQRVRHGDITLAGSDTKSQQTAVELFEAVTNGTVSTAPNLETVECLSTFERAVSELTRGLSNELAIAAAGIDIDVPTVIDRADDRCQTPIVEPGFAGHDPVGSGFLCDSLVDSTPILDSLYTAEREFPTLIAETVIDALSQAEQQQEEKEEDRADDTILLILGVPSTETATADAMPVTTLVRELVGAETRPLLCDPTADFPRSLQAHTVSIRTANRLSPAGIVILESRGAFSRLDWNQFDPRVVIDCCGGYPFDTGDATVHRLGSLGSTR